MKTLSSLGLAIALSLTVSAAMAADRHGKGHHKKGWSSGHHKVEKRAVHSGRHHARGRGHHKYRHNKYSSSHHSRHKYSHRRSYRYPHSYSHKYSRGYRRHHGHIGYRPLRHRYHHGVSYYSHDRVFPAVLGAAIVGSAITHSLYHTHGGSVCYDKHDNYSNNYRDSGYSEVVGCHRIERMPDGSERRVEVSMSECR